MRLDPRPRLALLGTALAASVLMSVTLGVGLAAAAPTNDVTNCGVNLRSSASTSATVVDSVPTGTTVTASGTASGGSWSATCGGANVSGTTWYVITAVNGVSTQSQYGKAALYAATGLFSSAPTPPPPGKWLEGIDVSHWQGTINWAGVAGAGKSFAIMKATESTLYVDSQYATNHASARANGIRTGAYHFAQPSTTPGDAIAEADWFVAHLNLQPGDLNPALDLEVANGLSVSALQAWVKAWLDEVYAKTGMRPMVYTSPSFWSSAMGGTSAIANAGYSVLWVAHWGVSSPTVPGNGWGGKGWTFWQYADNGSVAGIGGKVDLDRYNGQDLTPVTYGADFQVGATPASPSIKQGASTSIAVVVNRTWFTLPVALAVSGAPPGTTATLDTTTTSGNAATISFTTSSTGSVTPVGSYTLTVTGTSNGLTRTATATVNVTDGIAPTVTAPSSKLFAPSALVAGMPGRTVWSGTDASGISGFSLQQQRNGGAWTTVSLSPSTATSIGQQWTFNDTLRYRMRATDRAGNTTAWTYGASFKVSMSQDTSTGIHYSSGSWALTKTSYASGGTLHYTGTAGAWASQIFTGQAIAWVAYKGPNRGQARVYIDGVLAATVNLYQATYASKVVVFTHSWAVNGSHTIKIVCVGTAGHSRIDLDGFSRISML
jgi:GH25 family lysozyme M1 (1,4-beta-N-acetylmuramidase)